MTQGQKDASKIRKIGNKWTKERREKLNLHVNKMGKEDLNWVPDDLREPPAVAPYRTGFIEGEWEPKLLIGPNGFECYLGEPEDCSWARDGKEVVDELNRLHKLIQELRTKAKK